MAAASTPVAPSLPQDEPNPVYIPVRIQSASTSAARDKRIDDTDPSSMVRQYRQFMQSLKHTDSDLFDAMISNGPGVDPDPSLPPSNNQRRAGGPTVLPVTLSMILTEQEHDLFYVLDQTSKAVLDKTLTIPTRPDVRNITVRIAGGWVRDKIMGLPTHDVDVALDSCSGVEFAQLVQKWMHAYNQQAAQTDSNDPTSQQRRLINAQHSKIGVIAANPSQSKHLETATMKVCSLEVDFNNLRHEAYSDANSRIPTIAGIGTPYQDAMRRDFTMNALFYNVTESRIEDWTRRGMTDLVYNKRVQTPLPPYQTFQDDPLRVLRAIRFGVRYQYQLDDALTQAAKDPSIHAELQKKVSRERVGKELEGMLSGKLAHPSLAFKTIHDLNLSSAVFLLPTTSTTIAKATTTSIHGNVGLKSPTSLSGDAPLSEDLERAVWAESRECLDTLDIVLKYINEENTDGCVQTPLDRRLLYLATFLIPFFQAYYFGAKGKTIPVVDYMMREGIKFKNKDTTRVLAIVNNVEAMTQLISSVPEKKDTTDTGDLSSLSDEMRQLRLQAGLVLRSTKEMWLTTFAVAAVLVLQRQSATSPNASDSLLQRVEQKQRLVTHHLQLDECWKTAPLLNGKVIMKRIGLSRGPVVGEYYQEHLCWMLQNPTGTEEEALAHLLEIKRQKDASMVRDGDAEPKTKKIHLSK